MTSRPLAKQIGSRVRQLRTERQMTQGELANQLGTKYQTVSAWERGINTPDVDSLILLARVFDTTVDGILSLQPRVGRAA